MAPGAFGYAMPLGRLRGIPLTLHWTLPALVVGLALHDLLRFSSHAALVQLGIGLIWGLSVLVHELGHALVAHRLGYRTQSIELHAFGGVAQVAGWMSPRHDVAVSLSGPIANFGLYVLLSLVARELSGTARLVVAGGASFNLMLGLFNLLPAYPMDGGRALLSALRVKMGPVKGDHLAYTIGLAISLPGLLFAVVTSSPLMALAFYIAFDACRVQRARLDAAFGGNVVRPFPHGDAGRSLLPDWLKGWFTRTREPQPPKLRVIKGGRFEEPPDKRSGRLN